MNVGQMLSKHLVAAVLLIIVIALGTGIYFITKEKPEAELLPTQLTVSASVSTINHFKIVTLTATLTSNDAPVEGEIIEWSTSPNLHLGIPSLATDSSGQVSTGCSPGLSSYADRSDNTLTFIASFAGDNQYRESSESVNMLPSESLIVKVWGIADSYGSGVGYEIHSWTDNEAWASIYLEAENEPIPFENFYFQWTDNDWSMKGHKAWLVPSPSRALSIIDYTIRTPIVSYPPEFFEIPCLQHFIPVVKNSSRWAAFVASVGLRLENSTNRYEKSYPTMGRMIGGIVNPWETKAIGSTAPVLGLHWYEDENLPPPTKLLRMDHLEGKTFEITITLKDGAETVIAENTFTHTF